MWILFQGPEGHVHGKRGAAGDTLKAFTICLLNICIQLWPPDITPRHGLHSCNSRVRKMELTNHCFAEI